MVRQSAFQMGQTAINTTSQLVWLLGPALYLRLWHVNPAFQPPVGISYCVVLFWNGNKNVKVVGRPLNRVCWVKSTQNKIIVRIIEKEKDLSPLKAIDKIRPIQFHTKYIVKKNIHPLHYKVHFWKKHDTIYSSTLQSTPFNQNCSCNISPLNWGVFCCKSCFFYA